MILGLKIDWKLIRQRIKSWYARQSFLHVHGLNPERHKMRGNEQGANCNSGFRTADGLWIDIDALNSYRELIGRKPLTESQIVDELTNRKKMSGLEFHKQYPISLDEMFEAGDKLADEQQKKFDEGFRPKNISYRYIDNEGKPIGEFKPYPQPDTDKIINQMWDET